MSVGNLGADGGGLAAAAPRFFFFLLLVERELDGPGMVRAGRKIQLRGRGGFMPFYAARAPFGAGDRIGAGETEKACAVCIAVVRLRHRLQCAFSPKLGSARGHRNVRNIFLD